MRVALVHELLTMRGGAERVLKVFAEMFPEAPIFTLLYDEDRLGDWFPSSRVRLSVLQRRLERLPFFRRSRKIKSFLLNHHLHLSKFPATVEAWDFSEFDLVLSSSSAFIHGIITNGSPRHLCYVQSPARYLWDRTQDVLERSGHGLLGRIRRKYLQRTFHRLRLWDAESADRPDRLLAASREVERRIELYWRRESRVIHPPIDDFWFAPRAPSAASSPSIPYFLIVSSLVAYKRIDLAILAAKRAGVRLKIAGTGPDGKRLRRLAGERTEFLGFQSEESLKDLYAQAEATIFPGEEDFGLVPVESMACGTPVIAYRAGGALETIIEGTTGAFFDHPTTDALTEVLATFRKSAFDPNACRAQARKFSREKFEREIRDAIATMK